MRRLLAVILALAPFAAPGSASASPFAGYRDDGALDCDQLRLEIVRARAAVARLEAAAGDTRLAAVSVGAGALFVPGVDRFAVAVRPAVTSRMELTRQGRQRAAQRRLRATEARGALLAGLYQARGCRADRPRMAPPGPADTALGAAD